MNIINGYYIAAQINECCETQVDTDLVRRNIARFKRLFNKISKNQHTQVFKNFVQIMKKAQVANLLITKASEHMS